MTADPTLIRALAPTGTLRATINLGNVLLAKRHADGTLDGVTVDLARALAERLGLDLTLCAVDGASQAVAAVREQRADIGFFAIDPQRGAGLDFTPPYLVIEGSYLVAQDSPLQCSDDVDRAGVRVVVGAGSAYDLFLTRTLRYAQIVRAPTSQAVVDTAVAQGLEVAAGVRPALAADARRVGTLRLLDGAFMHIDQAMALPIERPRPALAFLCRWLETRKADGSLAALLARHGVEGAVLAPPGYPSGGDLG